MWNRRAFLFSTIGLASCVNRLHGFPFDEGFGTPSESLKVRFIGVGCFVVSYGGISVLTDPFWSHLSLSRVAFGRIAPDAAQIEPHLPTLDSVHAVLVGHGHYDHVLDLPYVVDKLHPDATIVGSRTIRHTFAPMNLPRKWAVMNDDVATPEKEGKPVLLAGGRLRVRAIRSGHPSQYMGFHLFRKSLTEDRKKPPTKVNHYQEGMTLAFLVDWLDETGGVAARVYIQTSSTGEPAGFFPSALLEDGGVDVGLLAMDCAILKAKGKRTIIDHMNPAHVVFCHWEDFFRPKTKAPHEIVKVNLPKLREAMSLDTQRKYFFPRWDAEFHFPNR